MKLNWSKWGYDFLFSLGRHVGTAGLAAAAICVRESKIDWRNLGVALLAGGVIPSVFTFLQSTPLPPDDDQPQQPQPKP